MNKNFLGICCLMFGSCASSSSFHLGEGSELAQNMSATKQKQRIALLQKRLEFAEKDLKKAHDEVEKLHGELHQTQLILIGKQIENYEKQMYKFREDPRYKAKAFQGDKISLFLKEREMLQEMMENGPSPEAFEAQVVLDRILRMITELKDSQENG